jgi:mRNA-degrading endonuclease toxin of MazEF toxin-antitoxin module
MGLAWSSTGDELIVSAGEGNERLAVYAVPATTTRSPALRRLAVPASARVLDVGKNGVWLLVPRL